MRPFIPLNRFRKHLAGTTCDGDNPVTLKLAQADMAHFRTLEYCGFSVIDDEQFMEYFEAVNERLLKAINRKKGEPK